MIKCLLILSGHQYRWNAARLTFNNNQSIIYLYTSCLASYPCFVDIKQSINQSYIYILTALPVIIALLILNNINQSYIYILTSLPIILVLLILTALPIILLLIFIPLPCIFVLLVFVSLPRIFLLVRPVILGCSKKKHK